MAKEQRREKQTQRQRETNDEPRKGLGLLLLGHSGRSVPLLAPRY